MKILINTPQEVGRLVRAARKAEKLRQNDAAGAMGVSRVFIWAMENGSPGIRLHNLLDVCRALGIQLSAEVSDEAAALYQTLKEPRPPRKRKQRKTTSANPA
jgi:transcriptional regulator with XRE-family HTH domain